MYSALRFLQWTAVIVAGTISLAAALHSAQGAPVFLTQAPWAELVSGGNNLKWLAPVLAALAVALGKAKAMIGPPWVWKAIQQALERYHEIIFGSDMAKDRYETTRPKDSYRITLLRHVRFVWWVWPFRSFFWPWGFGRGPWSGWLVPVRRTGGSDMPSRTVFLAPAGGHNAEGVAGKTWAQRSPLSIPPRGENLLPELSDPGFESLNQKDKESRIKDYAANTFVSIDWVKRRMRDRKLCARLLWGQCIEASFSKKYWGVLVVESEGEINREKLYSEVGRLSQELGTLVEGL
jgi:hypothetical protein